MFKLFVRLAASGAIAASLGAVALADSAGISVTGPGSTNVITSSNRNLFRSDINNRADLGNWNWQSARSGNVWIGGNTKVIGVGGSGNAFNVNSGENNLNINNRVGNGNWNGDGNWNNWGGRGVNRGSIFLTGPNSFNSINSSNSNRFNSNINNNVNAQNFNNQTARSGAVTITGNTVVEGVGGSGDATNVNSGTNTVNISNSVPTSNWNWGVGNNNCLGGLSTTGPWSSNRIGCSNNNSFNSNIQNNVNAQNFNSQTATTGSVNISGNTVVRDVGGSGNASNFNMGQNNVGVSNF